MQDENGKLSRQTSVVGDLTVDPDTLTADLEAALAESRLWLQSETRPITTLLTQDNQRIGPEPMTWAERNAHLATLHPALPSEASSLIQGLLIWVGRDAKTPAEAEEVNGLRQRAQALLHQSPTT